MFEEWFEFYSTFKSTYYRPFVWMNIGGDDGLPNSFVLVVRSRQTNTMKHLTEGPQMWTVFMISTWIFF